MFGYKFRRILRDMMRPIPVNTAATWAKRMRFVYIFASCNLLATILYGLYSGKSKMLKWNNKPDDGTSVFDLRKYIRRDSNIKTIHYSYASGSGWRKDYSEDDGEQTSEEDDGEQTSEEDDTEIMSQSHNSNL